MVDSMSNQRRKVGKHDGPAAIDLDRWLAYEQRNPRTFAKIYQFFVQRLD